VSGRPDRRARFAAAAGTLAGGTVALGPEVARHMQVMRLAAGDRVFLFDGEGVEVEGRLRTLNSDGVEVEVVGPVSADAESGLEIVLVQAVPVKVPRMDTIVRQCTELGVVRILPVTSARGQTPGGGNRALERRAERWRRIAATAAQQCGRARIPQIDEPAPWEGLEWAGLPQPRLLLHPRGAAMQEASGGDDVTGLTLLIGPEGGWSEEEIATAREAGAQPVACGPRVLRADTAGAVAVSLAQYLWGDLG